MFKEYIGILEATATKHEGMTARDIADMNMMSVRKASALLRSLEKEGMVKADRSGKVVYWQMTEKADDYLSVVHEKYSFAHRLDNMAVDQ